MSVEQVTAGKVNRVFVAWQDQQTRRFFPVASLSRQEDAGGTWYEFAYVRGVLDAVQQGFRPFEAFPNIKLCYGSQEMFPFFANRLVPKARDDYRTFVSNLGLDPETASPLDILARSGGRRATDSIETFARPVPIGEGDRGRTYFLAHGVRHMPADAQKRILQLVSGDRLYVTHDRQNPVDPGALLLRTDDYCNVGFVPRYLLPDTWQLVMQAASEDVRVFAQGVNPPPAGAQERLLCRMDSRLPEEFASGAHEALHPLVVGAPTA